MYIHVYTYRKCGVDKRPAWRPAIISTFPRFKVVVIAAQPPTLGVTPGPAVRSYNSVRRARVFPWLWTAVQYARVRRRCSVSLSFTLSSSLSLRSSHTLTPESTLVLASSCTGQRILRVARRESVRVFCPRPRAPPATTPAVCSVPSGRRKAKTPPFP